jgi:hypothetical protein|tara:strand:- start:153 stop:401 length:249 start_codon:yes stop_codon:yes gene_type:complete
MHSDLNMNLNLEAHMILSFANGDYATYTRNEVFHSACGCTGSMWTGVGNCEVGPGTMQRLVRGARPTRRDVVAAFENSEEND